MVPRIPNSTKCILQTADRIQNVDCRMQSGYKMQIENQQSFFVWYVITCHLTYLPSVAQSLFRDQLSRLFALLWNIPGPFQDQN